MILDAACLGGDIADDEAALLVAESSMELHTEVNRRGRPRAMLLDVGAGGEYHPCAVMLCHVKSCHERRNLQEKTWYAINLKLHHPLIAVCRKIRNSWCYSTSSICTAV